MQALQTTLRVLAVAIFGIALVHVLFGFGSEAFLGAAISAESRLDANLDSQNRFYGAAFALYGAMLWLVSTDLKKYAVVLDLVLLVFFLAGLVRIISIVVLGWPTTEILFLTALEIALPPGVYWWAKRLLRTGAR